MKTFWSIFIGLLVVIFALIFFGWNFAPSWISKTLTNKAKVPVSIKYLSLTPNSIGVFGLKVKNPKNSELTYALKAKKIKSQAPLMTYFRQNIVIDELKVSHAYLGLEFESALRPQGNWTVIMNNLRQSLHKDQKKPKENPKNVLIKRLIIKNLDIDLLIKQPKGKVQHLKPIESMEFENITSEGGLPTAQIMNLVMSEVLKEVFSQQNLMDMLKGTLQPPSMNNPQIFDGIKSLFSKVDGEA